MALSVGDIFKLCVIVEESDMHYYLINNNNFQWFDIVLPKYENDAFGDPTKFLNLLLEIGDRVTVKIENINIASDGTPGAFVTLIEEVENLPLAPRDLSHGAPQK